MVHAQANGAHVLAPHNYGHGCISPMKVLRYRIYADVVVARRLVYNGRVNDDTANGDYKVNECV